MGDTVRERPVLFSGPMVSRLLDGSKTQTRRVVDLAPVQKRGVLSAGEWRPFDLENALDRESVAQNAGNVCPYGSAGDRLWVREAWRTAKSLDEFDATAIAKQCAEANYEEPWAPVVFIADGTTRDWDPLWGPSGRYRHARFMPRWLSRLSLTVVSVRVQRLQDISEVDARAEGVERDDDPCDHTRLSCEEIGCTGPGYRSAFGELWNSINGKRPGASWAANPWVWCVGFERVRRVRP